MRVRRHGEIRAEVPLAAGCCRVAAAAARYLRRSKSHVTARCPLAHSPTHGLYSRNVLVFVAVVEDDTTRQRRRCRRGW